MNKKKYHLITSANESTWKLDRPVIFLGEWCRLYERKHIWENMDSIVAEPYGLKQSDKDADFSLIKNIEENIFSEFIEILNQYHGTNYRKRYWQIILGHWFKLSLSVIFKNVKTLQNCFKLYEISGTTFITNEDYELATQDYKSLIFAIYDIRWQSFLYNKILSLLDFKTLKIEIKKEKNQSNEYKNFRIKQFESNKSIKDRINVLAHKGYSFLANKFVKDNDTFIIDPYLPLKEEIKLNIALGQLPQLWKREKPEISAKTNKLLRKNLTKKFFKNSINDMENIIRQVLFELLPVVFLEGFKSLNQIVNKQPWPKSPKFIYTCSNFHTDEIFKLWSVLKIDKGTKYYIGQHGNNYGTSKEFYPRVEEETSDKFFTWGWKNNNSKFKSAFIFKTAKKKIIYNKQGGILLVQKPLGPDRATWDTFSEFNEYFKDQKNFVSLLSTDIKKKLTIKLSPRFRYKLFREDLRWVEFDPKLKIETRNIDINHLILDSRLIVHGYDSTGVLETLSQNIPSLVFLENGLNHLHENIKSDYQMLIDVGIMHINSTSLADKVNEIWDNINDWWEQKEVKEARIKFSNLYAKSCDHPAKKMSSLLMEDHC